MQELLKLLAEPLPVVNMLLDLLQECGLERTIALDVSKHCRVVCRRRVLVAMGVEPQPGSAFIHHMDVLNIAV